MRQLELAFVAAALMLIPAPLVQSDIVIYRTGTNDAMELDFDGAGTQTDGDLGFTSKTFVLTAGNGLPDSGTYPSFADITSITLEFTATGGNFSARNTAGTLSGGLGVTNGTDSNARSLDQDTLESIMVSISSTSTDPLKQVEFSGMRFSNWRNAFPVAQAEFTGATVGGDQYHLGGSGVDPFVDFDNTTSSFSIKSITSQASGGGWPLRLHDVRFTVTTIPEPAAGAMCVLALVGLCVRRRRRLPVVVE